MREFGRTSLSSRLVPVLQILVCVLAPIRPVLVKFEAEAIASSPAGSSEVVDRPLRAGRADDVDTELKSDETLRGSSSGLGDNLVTGARRHSCTRSRTELVSLAATRTLSYEDQDPGKTYCQEYERLGARHRYQKFHRRDPQRLGRLSPRKHSSSNTGLPGVAWSRALKTSKRALASPIKV